MGTWRAELELVQEDMRWLLSCYAEGLGNLQPTGCIKAAAYRRQRIDGDRE